jgi:sialic acid synthase SpsE
MFICEIGSNYRKSLEKALNLIKLASESGASIVKFQLFKADTLINKKAFDKLPKQAHQKEWADSVYSIYKKYELPIEWIPQLSDYAHSLKMAFCLSCYDINLIDEVDKYVDIWKIGSGDITYIEILQKIASKGKLILLGTGASTIDEVIIATNTIMRINPQLVLMQCNTDYTISNEKLKYSCVNVLKLYKTLFPDVMVGLSDHSRDMKPIYAALALGAKFIERHFDSKEDEESPDSKFAMSPLEFQYMVNESKAFLQVLGNTHKEVNFNEYEPRQIQRRALITTKNLKKGDIIKKEDFIALRPALINSLTPMFNIEGTKIFRDIAKDDFIYIEDIKIDKTSSN